MGQSITLSLHKVTHRVIQPPLRLVATLWCSSGQLEHAHGLSHQQCLQFNTSLSLAAAAVVVMLRAVVAQADC